MPATYYDVGEERFFLWEAISYGRDCMGNINGYVVRRATWKKNKHSLRADGLAYEEEIHERYIADVYVPGSHRNASIAAMRKALELNRAIIRAGTKLYAN